MMDDGETVNITILLPAGRLPLEMMAATHQLAEQYGFGLYLTVHQNLRLINVPGTAADDVKKTLAALGADFKGPGKFTIPRVCIGTEGCNLGVMNPEDLSAKILAKFAGREHTKAKFKIAIAACTMCCSGSKTTDIGIMATRDGYELFAGGKGGPFPQIGRRIARKVDEAKVLEIVEALVDFHDQKTEKKQRMYKLLSDPDFPFPEV